MPTIQMGGNHYLMPIPRRLCKEHADFMTFFGCNLTGTKALISVKRHDRTTIAEVILYRLHSFKGGVAPKIAVDGGGGENRGPVKVKGTSKPPIQTPKTQKNWANRLQTEIC